MRLLGNCQAARHGRVVNVRPRYVKMPSLMHFADVLSLLTIAIGLAATPDTAIMMMAIAQILHCILVIDCEGFLSSDIKA